jgi:hypothetical protein
MATIQNGLSGAFSGAVGNIIGSNWKDIDVMRGKPDHYHDAKSLKQQEIRSRFKAITKFTKIALRGVIRPIWENGDRKKTSTNIFVQTNLKAFDEYGELTNYDKLEISTGIIYSPRKFHIEEDATTKGIYNIEWYCGKACTISNHDDVLRVVALDKDDELNRIYEIDVEATRVDEKASINLKDFELATVELYFFFEMKSENLFSPSYHLEVEVPLLK